MAGREDHRLAAGERDRVDVRRRDAVYGERAPEPLDVVPGAGDPDDRAAHTASTTAVTARAMPEAYVPIAPASRTGPCDASVFAVSRPMACR